jgi:sugar phosphate isomerase/epimerase
MLLEKLAANKLAVTTISTGQAYALDGLCLSSFDDGIRYASIDVVKGHVDLSVRIGRPPVTIGLLRGKFEKGGKPALLETLRRSLSPCLEYAEKRGVILQIEPICKEETELINNVYEALEFLDSLGNPENAGILYDTFHSNHEDGGMAEAIRAAAGKITNVHLADSHRGLPGGGYIDFSAVIRELRSIGYRGALALETLATNNITTGELWSLTGEL